MLNIGHYPLSLEAHLFGIFYRNHKSEVLNDRTNIGDERTNKGDKKTNIGDVRTNIGDVRTNIGEERTEQVQGETRAGNELQQGQINKTLVIHQTRKV